MIKRLLAVRPSTAETDLVAVGVMLGELPHRLCRVREECGLAKRSTVTPGL
jgi:hypothetical protein